MSRTMGPSQIQALQCLVSHGAYPGGWIWDNHSTTVRLLESLVKRGFVERNVPEVTAANRDHVVYRITDNGRVALAILRLGKV